jgi:hypothetical protein
MTVSDQADELLALAKQLGFNETPTMVELRKKIWASTSIEEARALYKDYHECQQLQPDAQDFGGAKAELGFMLMRAALWWGFGDNERYIEVLADATHFAGISFEEIDTAVQRLLQEATDDREQVSSLLTAVSGIISPEDRDELKTRPMRLVLEELPALLYAEGHDADEVLRQAGLNPQVPPSD